MPSEVSVFLIAFDAARPVDKGMLLLFKRRFKLATELFGLSLLMLLRPLLFSGVIKSLLLSRSGWGDISFLLAVLMK